MSTRCLICRTIGKGSVRGIYCHFDGYPAGVGEMLFNCYQSARRLDQLFRRGDISSLGPTPNRATHPFGWDPKHGADEEYAAFVCTENDIVKGSRHIDVEYVYLWRKGAWWVAENEFGKSLQPFVRLETKLSGRGCVERLRSEVKAESKLASELTFLLCYLNRSSVQIGKTPFVQFGSKILMAYRDQGFIESNPNLNNGELRFSERGLDLAWHLLERYDMTSGLRPAEPYDCK